MDTASEIPKPTFKRKRTALACDSCRRRKSRCDGARPACKVCVELGFDCIYHQPAPPSSSKRPTTGTDDYESRLTAVERTLRVLFDERVGPRSRSSTLHRDSHGQTSPASVSFRDLDDEHSEIIEDETADMLGHITFADEVESGYFGPSSNVALTGLISGALMSSATLFGRNDHDPLTGQSRQSDLTSLFRPSSPAEPHSSEPNELRSAINQSALPPERELLEVVRVYFQNTGMLFPFIDERAVLQGYEIAKQRKFKGIRRSWLGLLNMILAFGTIITPKLEEPAQQRALAADAFYYRAQALSKQAAFRIANLETVQFLILMAMYLQATQRSAQTWNIHGLATRGAVHLGLHFADQPPEYTVLQKEVRKRTWFAVVLLDRTLSMTFGRPLAIPNEQIGINMPTNADLKSMPDSSSTSTRPDAGSVQPQSTACFFIATIDLYNIIAEILTSLYGRNVTPDKQKGHVIHDITTSTDSVLETWRTSLPMELRFAKDNVADFRNVRSENTFYRLRILLYLRYLNTKVLLHRAMVERHLALIGRVQPTNLANKDETALYAIGTTDLQTCLDSALLVISTVHAVRAAPSLIWGWWFPVYYTFNASLIVFSVLLIKRSGRVALPANSIHSLLDSLKLALEALNAFGGDTKMVVRCRAFVGHLLNLAVAICDTQGQEVGTADYTVSNGLNILDGPKQAQAQTHKQPNRSDSRSVSMLDGFRSYAQGNFPPLGHGGFASQLGLEDFLLDGSGFDLSGSGMNGIPFEHIPAEPF